MTSLIHNAMKDTAVHVVVDHEHGEEEESNPKKLLAQSVSSQDLATAALALSGMRTSSRSLLEELWLQKHGIVLRKATSVAQKHNSVLPFKEESASSGVVSDDEERRGNELDSRRTSKEARSSSYSMKRKRTQVSGAAPVRRKRPHPMIKPRFFSPFQVKSGLQAHSGSQLTKFYPLPLPPRLPRVPAGHKVGG